jgi:hypothetical protein
VADTLRVWDRGVVNFNSGLMSTGPLLVHGGRINVSTTGGTKVLRTTDVQTSAGGRIDLTTNAMTVEYAASPEDSPLLSVKAQVVAAYNAGAWDGPGITTSAGNASQFGLGYGEASALTPVPTIFGSVDATTVLVRYTRYGDANLDAAVNLLDFNSLAANFGQSNRVWTDGDFNYDSIVSLLDFNLLAADFGLSASAGGPTPQDWAALAAAVPEPGAVVLAALLGGTMIRRRRRDR